MNEYMLRKETQEAIESGINAIRSLEDARAELKKASSWGLLDMLGGGMITGLIKHSKLENANSCLDDARYELQIFTKELSDVSGYYDLDLEIDGFLQFADFFMDGFLADFLVQNQIRKTIDKVDKAIYHVDSIVRRLISAQ